MVNNLINYNIKQHNPNSRIWELKGVKGHLLNVFVKMDMVNVFNFHTNNHLSLNLIHVEF